MQNIIKLQTDSILQAPLQKYFKDFTFIVNSERYETSSFIADLLSPIISSRHLIVEFKNVEQETIIKFTNLFDINDLTTAAWSSICDRLQQKVLIENEKSNRNKHEYKREKYLVEVADKPNEFDGILNYLQTHSNIKDEIDITYSSYYGHTRTFELLKYDDSSPNSYFETSYSDNDSWVCFEFKNHQIIPSSYIVRSYNSESNWHLKSWNFEGSNDKSSWIILDSQRDNSSLKGANKVKSFTITNHQSFKYLRMHLTGPNWYNNNGLMMNSIEFYGKII